MAKPFGKVFRTLRAARLFGWRRVQIAWREFRTGLNISWLALRDPAIGWAPKASGAVAALFGVMPLEWVPGVHPIAVLLANFVVIPGLLWLAWLVVSPDHKARLAKEAGSLPTPWAFFALVAAILFISFAIDLAMDLAFPGQDAYSPMIDGWVNDWLGEGDA
ncbi:MAG: hypothetical protein AAF251_16430 [Pseudomonadota bacterium]